MTDGVAYGFFQYNIHPQILRNRLRDSNVAASLLEIFVIENTGLLENDAELSALAQKARKSGNMHMAQIICGPTNHNAASELKRMLEEAHNQPYRKGDLTLWGIYYKKGTAYTRFR